MPGRSGTPAWHLPLGAGECILVIADVASKETILFCDSLRIIFQSKVTLVVDANRQPKFQDTYCSPGSTQGRLTACSFEERVSVERVTTHFGGRTAEFHSDSLCALTVCNNGMVSSEAKFLITRNAVGHNVIGRPGMFEPSSWRELIP